MRRLFAKTASARRTDVPQPGDLVAGKYRVLRVVGRGGMGVVLAAHHEVLDQPVAVKVLTVVDPKAISRFLREARATASLGGPHVARVMDAGTLPCRAPFIVMEFLEGCDLKDLLEARRVLPIKEAIDYVLQACQGLAQAHAVGIVHRDLKPANLFRTVQPSGATLVKIVDFGISKPLAGASGEKAGTLTEEHTTLGSPAYMAPEQIRAAKGADTRADLWSLGVVLFELLTGVTPFARGSLGELFVAILETEAPRLTTALPGAPVALADAIATCVQRDPERRFQSVLELARALAPFGPDDAAVRVASIEQTLRTLRVPAPLPADTEPTPLPVPVARDARAAFAAQVTAHVAFTSDTPGMQPILTSAMTPSTLRLQRRLWTRAAGVASLLAAVATAAIFQTNLGAGSAPATAEEARAGAGEPRAPAPLQPSPARAEAPVTEIEPIPPLFPVTALPVADAVPPPTPSVKPAAAPPRAALPAPPKRTAPAATRKHLSVLDSPD